MRKPQRPPQYSTKIVMVETQRLLIDARPSDDADGRGELLQALQVP